MEPGSCRDNCSIIVAREAKCSWISAGNMLNNFKMSFRAKMLLSHPQNVCGYERVGEGAEGKQ